MAGRKPRVVVIGGANMDLKCRVDGKLVLGTSNPGTMTATPGGVGRNIAESLARLGLAVTLISAVGRDAFGDEMAAATRAAGVDARHLFRAGAPTGTYTAILDGRGELLAGVAAMDILATLTPRRLARARGIMQAASLLVIDSNLPIATIEWVMRFASDRDLPLAIEAVSVPKAKKIGRLLRSGRAVFALFCNGDELDALVGTDLPTQRGLRDGARRLHDLGIRHIGVGLGPRGMLTSSALGARIVQRRVTPVAGPLAEVTGAGDAAVAGTLFGLLGGHELERAAMYGQAAASVTRASPLSVSPRLSPKTLHRLVRASFGPT